MKKKWILVILLIVGIALAFVVIKYTFRKAAPNVADKKADVELTAMALVEAFENNEQAANALYLGKIVIINGTVESVSHDSLSSIYIKDPASVSGVICGFDQTTSDITTVHKGEEIHIKGVCTGYLMDVILNKCSIEPASE
jgi:hypothetical protein